MKVNPNKIPDVTWKTVYQESSVIVRILLIILLATTLGVLLSIGFLVALLVRTIKDSTQQVPRKGALR